MGFDLTNEVGEEFQFSNAGWRYVMEFAGAHGFHWPTDAGGDEVEALTSPQAQGFAEALKRGLGTGPADQVAPRVSEELTRLLVTPSASPMFAVDPIRIDARTVDYWRQFIDYARRGGFSISF